MLDHLHAIGPKEWWTIVGFSSDALDKRNLTQAQKDCLQLDTRAQYYLTRVLHEDILRHVWDLESAHDMWLALQALFGDSSTSDDGKFKEDDHKEEVHECVEHEHDLVIVEDCSTSWSSDDDDRSTISSLDKMDGDVPSDANDDSTSSTLGDDGSCSSHDYDATTSPSTTPHCFMSQCDTKVSNANMVDHVVPYDGLVSRLASMIMSLENEKAKIVKLENENSFLKKSCEEHKNLLDVLKSSHGELKLNHGTLLVSLEELLEQHASLIKAFSSQVIKRNM
jgi:hypothetical protein